MSFKDKEDALYRRMERLGIREEDLIEKFVLGSGKGGQKINKTSVCVYLKHLPTGIEIKCQQGRSRETNRIIARTELCRRIEERQQALALEKTQAREKLRRQKRRPTRQMKAKMIESKKRRSAKKSLRKSPSDV